jgi:hypothetical protein
MRRGMMAGAFALAVVLGAIMALPALAAPSDKVIMGVVRGFSKDANNFVLEARKCSDGSYDVVYFSAAYNKVVMKKFKGKDSIFQTPLETFDVDKIKASGATLPKEWDAFVKSELMAKRGPIIQGAALRLNATGKVDALFHVFNPAGGYQKTWVVDGETGTLSDKTETLSPDPGTSPWSAEEKAAGDNNFPESALRKGSESNAEAMGLKKSGAKAEATGEQTEGAAAESTAAAAEKPAAKPAKPANAGGKGGFPRKNKDE